MNTFQQVTIIILNKNGEAVENQQESKARGKSMEIFPALHFSDTVSRYKAHNWVQTFPQPVGFK